MPKQKTENARRNTRTRSTPDTKKTRTNKPRALHWQLPESLGIPPDPVRMVINFHDQAVVVKTFGEINAVKIVSANDIAHALSEELGYSTGILPGAADSANTLYWQNTKDGPVLALYEPPRVCKLVMDKYDKEPKVYEVPAPGLVFLCRAAKAPAVFAVKQRPAGEMEKLYHAPFPNVYENGKSCPGSHRYPADTGKIPEHFLRSLFAGSGYCKLSDKFGGDVVKLWESLKGKKEYPLDDLIEWGPLANLVKGGFPGDE
jgi:hypothetical protein